jgi:hypothetical protein
VLRFFEDSETPVPFCSGIGADAFSLWLLPYLNYTFRAIREEEMPNQLKIFLTIGVLAWAVPAAAQAPTTAFDGTYAGVSMHVTKATREAQNCPRGGVPQPLTITNGVVKPPAGKGWIGTVSPDGALTIRNQYAMHVHAQIDAQGNVTGRFTGPQCNVSYVWKKQAG